MIPARLHSLATTRAAAWRLIRVPARVNRMVPSTRSSTTRSRARAVRGDSAIFSRAPPLRMTHSVRCPRSDPRSWMSALHASETRSPFNTRRLINASSTGHFDADAAASRAPSSNRSKPLRAELRGTFGRRTRAHGFRSITPSSSAYWNQPFKIESLCAIVLLMFPRSSSDRIQSSMCGRSARRGFCKPTSMHHRPHCVRCSAYSLRVFPLKHARNPAVTSRSSRSSLSSNGTSSIAVVSAMSIPQIGHGPGARQRSLGLLLCVITRLHHDCLLGAMAKHRQ